MSQNANLTLVTGAASGIGEAIAKRFAAEKHHVAIIDLDETAATRVATDITDAGHTAHPFPCDVSDHNAVHKTFNEIFAMHGPPGILVNNAGIAHIGTLETTSPEDFDRLFAVNVRGVYNGMHAAIKPMVENGGGVILNMASIAANTGLPDRFAYSMSKAAVQNMTLTVARDFLDKNIRCNCLCPARVHTPFVDHFLAENYPGQEKDMFEKLSAAQPIGRMANPAEIAEQALHICSEKSAYITGNAIDIDGGFTNLR
ncbi:MAG: SDR family oxidoreductase [Verrucomicrobiota bacterium]